MRIGQDRIAVDAFLAPRLAHELVQLASPRPAARVLDLPSQPSTCAKEIRVPLTRI